MGHLCSDCRFNKPDGSRGIYFPQYRRCSAADKLKLPHWIETRIGMHPYDGGIRAEFNIQQAGPVKCDTYKQKGRKRDVAN